MISKAITLGKEGKIEFIAKKILDIACEVTLHMQYGEKIILSQFSKENFHPYSYEIEGTFQISITHPEAIIMNHFIAYDSDVMKNGVIHITCDNGSITPITHENLEAFYLENPLRPKIHFTSPRGWINDPNGLCYFQGNYHLFYQYYPHDSVWGNMHWGHAISKDLIHWTHLPITLYPEIEDVYFGGAFSGSALIENDKMYLFYTHHFEDTRGKVKFQNTDFIENQCVVESDDGLDFRKWSAPVVESAKRADGVSNDFRDPKVWLDKDNRFKMILGSAYFGKPSIQIYESLDLKTWTECGPLYVEESIVGRCIECPDIFELDGQYVMLASIIEKIDGKEKHVTRYHVGEFNNNRFISKRSEIIDFGPSFYAIQTFEGPLGRTAIAWLDSWQDLNKSCAKTFAGAMSLPLTFSLSQNRLRMVPVEAMSDLISSTKILENSQTVERVESSAFAIKAKLARTHLNGLNLKASNSIGDYVQITTEKLDKSYEMVVLISESGEIREYKKAFKLEMAELDIHAVFDRTSLELMFNDYCDRGSFRFYFKEALSTLECYEISEESSIKIEYYYSIWRENGNN